MWCSIWLFPPTKMVIIIRGRHIVFVLSVHHRFFRQLTGDWNKTGSFYHDVKMCILFLFFMIIHKFGYGPLMTSYPFCIIILIHFNIGYMYMVCVCEHEFFQGIVIKLDTFNYHIVKMCIIIWFYDTIHQFFKKLYPLWLRKFSSV